MNAADPTGWDRLRHGGLLLDAVRLRRIAEKTPPPLQPYHERELRKAAARILDEHTGVSDFIAFVLETVCGFTAGAGSWQRGSQVGAEWGRRAITGDTIKPRHLWRGSNGALLPVFIDTEARLGIGRGRKAASQVIQWLRAGNEKLALLTNGRQWRLIFAGLDFDAWCEWDVDLWFEEGIISSQVHALRILLSPALWTPPSSEAHSPLLEAILDSRKGQAELSATLGERVREAVELLVQGHGEVLSKTCAEVAPADIYRAAVRVIMRMVVVLFAESRELLPRDNALYHASYGLADLLEGLEKIAARGGGRLARSWNAWPRVLALFRLVHQGSHHQALLVPAYGGELFAPGDASSPDGLQRALAVFETAVFNSEMLPDRDVHRILEFITRTRVKVRQGRSSTWMPAPVDFSDLSSEYIGILYEGLLDFELKTAPPGDPVIFLAVGNQPALPLSRLEAMDDKALANLFEKMKESKSDSEEEKEEEAEPAEAIPEDGRESDEPEEPDQEEGEQEEQDGPDDRENDQRHITRTRAESWARHAVEACKLAPRPRGALTPEKRLAYEETLARKARQLVSRVILPGEWYLVRWGGTRKGAGTFYTRPGLAVPTVQRTLRPLAYVPPKTENGASDQDAPATQWAPRAPEEILELKVCDPACGSGTFPVAALRFLTDALYRSLHHHARITPQGNRAIVSILSGAAAAARPGEEQLGHELLPCLPDDALFEPRLKAILRRYVVERSIYGVDLDPLAVELCRLSLWIETMDRTLPFSFLDHKIKCGNSLVGAWFDQFQHYPVMAWKNREGGDKNHSNGVHFQKEERGRALKAFVKEELAPDLRAFLAGRTLFSEDLQEKANAVHARALDTLARLHDLPVQDSAERARIYREELLGSQAYCALKEAMDLWCACWFWPADDLEHAPLPTTLAAPSPETLAQARRIAGNKRFFHWEVEFPDVFRAAGSGFDAILGNPPWDIAKPNSMEFFSNIDPLYRSYGKQEALQFQTDYFATAEIEKAWIAYNADFRAQSNYMGYAANVYGDPAENEKSQDRFAIAKGKENDTAHFLWKKARAQGRGFADPAHPFRRQGAADINLYKAFLEQAYVLLRPKGRLGFIVPSGLYSDHGTGALRHLFLNHCRWEWLFGFENRDGIFRIHRSFKFNPVIVEKGGKTAEIQTAFMRRKLEDWEKAELYAVPYTRAQIERFSPRSRAILEIQSRRDLEILEKIYSNSVLLGDEGPDGWGIQYATEFHMTNDSKLFPPRPKWEADGYRPDEYSRWLKGDWRPIDELWAELGIDPAKIVSLDPTCEAEISRRAAETQRTDFKLRCAQPPYDTLPVPRAAIPAGIILSRAADAWIKEAWIVDIALSFMQGAMLNQYDYCQKGWLSGTGLQAKWQSTTWENKVVNPQFLMGIEDTGKKIAQETKIAFRRIARNTDVRTLIASLASRMPCGDVASVLQVDNVLHNAFLLMILNSFILDRIIRLRVIGTHVDYHYVREAPILPLFHFEKHPKIALIALILNAASVVFSPEWTHIKKYMNILFNSWKNLWCLTDKKRTEARVNAEIIIAALEAISVNDLLEIFKECDYPIDTITTNFAPTGFWRIDKDKDPELRHTVLTLVAFHDLEEKIRACGGDREKGIEAFLNQNDGQGWMLPETLRLADYGLGHDERARRPQPVASRLGPRFYDWQLAQTAEESWCECHLHARNLLGESGYERLLAEIEPGRMEEPSDIALVAEPRPPWKKNQGSLF